MTAANSNGLFGRALLGSVAVHALVALLIPALAWTAAGSPSVETISFVRVLRVARAPARPPLPPPLARAPRRAPAAKISLATRHQIARERPERRAVPRPRIATRDASVAPARAAVTDVGTASGTGTSAPEATATPLSRTVATVGSHAGGYLPFGAEQPVPVLDPNVMRRLAALGVHVTLVVTVDDSGRTQHVAFQPPLDAQMEARIQSLLADANWDPAVCGGGVTCQGQAVIKL
jgi:hypothetical protein